MKKTILVLIALVVSHVVFGQVLDSAQIMINNIEQSLNYQYGTIALEEGNAKINVPEGFKFLDKEQSVYVLTDLWGNPSDESVLGMLLPEGLGVLDDNGWVFCISYENLGYVDDEDAGSYDYEGLEEELKEELENINPERIKQGYQPMHFIGWASSPYYDNEKKVLHWAKEIQFGEDDVNTLNYNLRILGRKGVFMFNAISLMPELKSVDVNIDKVLASVEFNEGFTYFDFDPDIDNVAQWTIGGLVAGKVLAKVGFFALIIKFWKFIALGAAGLFSFLWKKKKSKDVVAIKEQSVKDDADLV